MENEPPNPRPIPYRTPVKGLDSPGWVQVKKKRLVNLGYFPPYCCMCLKETANRWDVPLVHVGIDLPICPECERRARRRHLIVLAIGLLLTFAATVLGIIWIPTGSWTLSIGYAGGIFFTSWLTTMVIWQLIALPVRPGWWVRDQEVGFIYFRNLAYWELIRNRQLANQPPEGGKGGGG